jgi:mxaK protein
VSGVVGVQGLVVAELAVRRRVAHFAFGAVALVCAALATYQTVRLVRSERVNAAIASAQATGLDTDIPEAQFARALALASAGKSDAALGIYKTLARSPRVDIKRAALYNTGNLYMRDAARRNADEGFESLPLVELAKQAYREVLRQQPDNWDARYNLERALMLAPEVEYEGDESDAPLKEQRVMSTIRGEAVNLP